MDSKKLSRFGVSMEETLLQKFDLLVNEKGYKNRSEAVRDLVRESLVKNDWTNDDQLVAGSILMFYDHHQRNLVEALLDIQHNYHNEILATTHFHIDHHNCLEMIVVKGQTKKLRALQDQIISLKGVKYSKLTVSPISDI